MLLCNLLESWCYCLARTTPVGIEVNNGGLVAKIFPLGLAKIGNQFCELLAADCNAACGLFCAILLALLLLAFFLSTTLLLLAFFLTLFCATLFCAALLFLALLLLAFFLTLFCAALLLFAFCLALAALDRKSVV